MIESLKCIFQISHFFELLALHCQKVVSVLQAKCIVDVRPHADPKNPTGRARTATAMSHHAESSALEIDAHFPGYSTTEDMISQAWDHGRACSVATSGE